MNQKSPNFPETIIRGISSPTHIEVMENIEIVCLEAFEFRSSPDRTDNYEECSINWEDDLTVVDFTLNQKNENGEYKFRVGLTKIKKMTLIEHFVIILMMYFHMKEIE